MDLKKIGACIKENREKQDMTIKDLSNKTGIEGSVLESYESGIQKLKAKELKRIAAVIGVPLLILVHGGGVVETLERTEKGKTFCRWHKY